MDRRPRRGWGRGRHDRLRRARTASLDVRATVYAATNLAVDGVVHTAAARFAVDGTVHAAAARLAASANATRRACRHRSQPRCHRSRPRQHTYGWLRSTT
jgi:hypothetical protein